MEKKQKIKNRYKSELNKLIQIDKEFFNKLLKEDIQFYHEIIDFHIWCLRMDDITKWRKEKKD